MLAAIRRKHAVTMPKVRAAIDYLKSRGARTAYVGSCFPNAPFYLGLYGGSQVPGVLVDDVASVNALQSFGFVEDDQIVIPHGKSAHCP